MLPLFSPHHHTPPSSFPFRSPSALCCCLTHFSSGVSRMSSTHPTEKGIRELFDPLFACTVSGIVSDGVLKRKKSTEEAGRQSADDHGRETVLFSCLTIKMESSRRPTSSITVSLQPHISAELYHLGVFGRTPPQAPPLKKPRTQRLWFRHASLSSSSGCLGGGASNLKGTHKETYLSQTKPNTAPPPKKPHQNL